MSLFSIKNIVCYIILCHCASTLASKHDGLLKKLKNGLKYAKDYLETAREIANLVANSLKQQNNNKRRDDDNIKNDKIPKEDYSRDLTSIFFRLLGLDSPKIAAITVNSAIFLAQLINTLVESKQEVSRRRAENINNDDSNFDPLKFILTTRNEKVQNLLKQAQSSQLPNQLINQLDITDSPCVRLLVCKITPIILHAQQSLMNKKNNKKFDLISWLPNRELFEENSDNCEEKFVECKVFPDE